MASDLFSIGLSGVKAARTALEVTGQNIANASSDGYVRRSIRTAEISASGTLMASDAISLSGVRVTGLSRNADMFRQLEVRRTASDSARSSAELQGLENIESAIEQARTFDLTVEFEASLRALSADPTDPSLRASTMAAAQNMANGFNLANSSLTAAGDGMRFETKALIDETNVLANELSRVNTRIARTQQGTGERATLLDQRDNLLERLAGKVDIKTTFNDVGMVEVRLGGTGGEIFVQGETVNALSSTTAADGTLTFAVGGNAVAITGGSIAGKALALQSVAERSAALDALAAGAMATINTAQTNGAALDGSAGQPLFTGTGAGDMALAFFNGAGLATAPAGSPANSTDGANLTAMRQAFDAGAHAQKVSDYIFTTSANVAGKRVTGEALDAIASAARIALDQQSGVDLDQEAANLVRFQQAFQASSRAMQVAGDIFDTLLGIR